MILRQLLQTEPIVAASYVVGCAGNGVSAVIDPLEHIEPYLRASEEYGMRIRYVIDTHVHADHISGGHRLAESVDGDYVLGPGTNAQFPYREVDDGDILELGNVELRVLHTPGHTPEHISLLVIDRTRGPDPWCVFTGHTLMVGDMGRTELATTAEQGARDLFKSAQKLRTLPDDLCVLPGAFAGSVCGRDLSGNPISTLGFERRFNRAFALEDVRTFTDYMLKEIPERPARAEEIRATNLGSVALDA